jgi:hypothetical protein
MSQRQIASTLQRQVVVHPVSTKSDRDEFMGSVMPSKPKPIFVHNRLTPAHPRDYAALTQLAQKSWSVAYLPFVDTLANVACQEQAPPQ